MQSQRRLLGSLLAGLFGSIAVAAASGQVISETLKLLPENGHEEDYFGCSVALMDGGVAIGADGVLQEKGSVFLFDNSTGQQAFELRAQDRIGGAQFGWSVAMDEGIIAVGAPFIYAEDRSGWAYLFDAITGEQLAKLIPDDAQYYDYFGYLIAMDAGLVAVGAPGDFDNGPSSGSGYVFEVATGRQVVKLLPTDGLAHDGAGTCIDIQDGIVALGAPFSDSNGVDSGCVYLFDAHSGTQLFKLLPDDGEADASFGSAVAIENGVLAVGAFKDDARGVDSGSVYLFDLASGAQIAKYVPEGESTRMVFGEHLAVERGVLAVAAPGYSSGAGAAYLIHMVSGERIAILLASDGESGDRFASSIALRNGIVAVGAPYDSEQAFFSGSAYLFRVPTLPHLDLMSSCPDAGPFRVRWTRATPDDRAAILYSHEQGLFTIPGSHQCPGTALALGPDQLQVVLVRTSDSNGRHVVNGMAPGRICGGYLQLLDLSTCYTSNVIPIQ